MQNGTCDGACCNYSTGDCVDNVLEADCPPGSTFNRGLNCANLDCHATIPTVSEWGLVIMALLLLTCGKLYFGRKMEEATN